MFQILPKNRISLFLFIPYEFLELFSIDNRLGKGQAFPFEGKATGYCKIVEFILMGRVLQHG